MDSLHITLTESCESPDIVSLDATIDVVGGWVEKLNRMKIPVLHLCVIWNYDKFSYDYFYKMTQISIFWLVYIMHSSVVSEHILFMSSLNMNTFLLWKISDEENFDCGGESLI